jgi:hypothetical protein
MVRLYPALLHSFSINSEFFCVQNRATRIALALAFARVLQRTRHYAISLAIMFLCIFIAVLIQALSCNNDFAWTTTSFSQCDSHGELIIFLVIGMCYLSFFSLCLVFNVVFVANLFADFLLVFSPLYALRRLRLPTHERRLIFACFAGSAFMSLACITTTVFQFLPAPQWAELRIITAYLEVS